MDTITTNDVTKHDEEQKYDVFFNLVIGGIPFIYWYRRKVLYIYRKNKIEFSFIVKSHIHGVTLEI